MVAFCFGQAQAALVTKSYAFQASNFAPAGSLVNTAPGEFSFTYDDTVAFTNDAVPDAISVIIGTATYTTANTRVDVSLFGNQSTEIIFGALTGENQGIFTGIPNDFILGLTQDSEGNITVAYFQYTGAGPQIFNAQTTTVLDTTPQTPVPVNVPIPLFFLFLLAILLAHIAKQNSAQRKNLA